MIESPGPAWSTGAAATGMATRAASAAAAISFRMANLRWARQRPNARRYCHRRLCRPHATPVAFRGETARSTPTHLRHARVMAIEANPRRSSGLIGGLKAMRDFEGATGITGTATTTNAPPAPPLGWSLDGASDKKLSAPWGNQGGVSRDVVRGTCWRRVTNSSRATPKGSYSVPPVSKQERPNSNPLEISETMKPRRKRTFLTALVLMLLGAQQASAILPLLWIYEIHCSGSGVNHSEDGGKPDTEVSNTNLGTVHQCHGDPGNDHGSCVRSHTNNGDTINWRVNCWTAVNGDPSCNAIVNCPGGGTISCGGRNQTAFASRVGGDGFVTCQDLQGNPVLSHSC